MSVLPGCNIRLVASMVLGLIGLMARQAEAEEQRAVAEEEIRWDPRVDVPLLAGSGLLWAGIDLIQGDIDPELCRWCARNRLDDSVADALVWVDTTAAQRTSDLTAFVVTPVTAVGLLGLMANRDGRGRNWPVDAMLVAQTGFITADLTQVAKYSFGRQRPNLSDNLSFFSGHTSVAFALAVSSGTVATIRGYRDSRMVWMLGMTAATASGYLRIAGDKHYFTDVMTGALVGSAVGFLVPYLHRNPRRAIRGLMIEGLSASAAERGGVISVSGRWW